MKTLNTESYSVSEPSFSQYGASMTAHFKDNSWADIEVEMSWCSRNDTLETDRIHVDYYDQDDNEVDADIVEMEKLVIEVCDHFKTFGKVEREIEKAYHADHQ